MIQANEVRIGNWVVKFKGGMHYQLESGDDIDRYYNDMYGIPITPEILRKFGFEMDHSTHDVCSGWRKGSVFILDANEYGYHPEAGSVELKHLHQLQNLYFALTGEELEIKSI